MRLKTRVSTMRLMSVEVPKRLRKSFEAAIWVLADQEAPRLKDGITMEADLDDSEDRPGWGPLMCKFMTAVSVEATKQKVHQLLFH